MIAAKKFIEAKQKLREILASIGEMEALIHSEQQLKCTLRQPTGQVLFMRFGCTIRHVFVDRFDEAFSDHPNITP
ncbi:hypothetical protein [Rhodopseudomonas palustris]|uniref:hypothetical protein n=1 Tax=Rhodopseudomonas palustris TaxID=1076 RepID=UPI0012EDF2C1